MDHVNRYNICWCFTATSVYYMHLWNIWSFATIYSRGIFFQWA